jgi:Ca2+-binding RTX toxin-like protein
MRRHGPTLTLALLVLALVPATAHAGLARVVTEDEPNSNVGAFSNVVRFAAYHGETNGVTAWTTGSGESSTVFHFADAGATIDAGDGCTSVSTHEVSCAGDLSGFGSIRLGDGNDTFRMLPGNAASQDEQALGGTGDDTLTGGDGTDFLDGGPGRDELHGGAGSDTLSDSDAHGALRSDLLDGGTNPTPSRATGQAGDVVDYTDRHLPVRVDLPQQRGGAKGEGDRLAGVEGAVGGHGDDTLIGTDGPNLLGDAQQFVSSLHPRTGTDHVSGGGGGDVLISHDGRDVLHGGGDADLINCRFGACRAYGGGGDDQLQGDSNLVRFSGGPGDDTLELLLGGKPKGTAHLSGDSGDDLLDARAGSQLLRGGTGHDRLLAGAGNDTLEALDHEQDAVSGGTGHDAGHWDRGLDHVTGVERRLR